MFHSIILYLIHKCIDLLFRLRLFYKDICFCVRHILSLWAGFLLVQEPDKQVWLKKLPSHLGIIICEDRISFNDISNIIIWCLCQGIHHVSFYDDGGFIKLNGEELYNKANFKKDLHLKDKSHSFNLVFSDGKTPYLYNNIMKNGHRTENMHIYLLSQIEGKQAIVKAARNFCEDARKDPEILKTFHAKEFGNYIKVILDVPDPDMILLFGCKNGVIGYLPWHIRLSEILSYPTHNNFQYEEFKELLLRYSKCEQRFGK